MENLFVINSQHDINKLKRNKKFLTSIIDQLSHAYSNIHITTSDYRNSTEVRIGCHKNMACCHSFKILEKKGIIEYSSYPTLLFDSERYSKRPNYIKANELLEKHPDSTWRKQEFQLKLEIRDESDFRNKVKDIVWALELDGFTLSR